MVKSLFLMVKLLSPYLSMIPWRLLKNGQNMSKPWCPHEPPTAHIHLASSTNIFYKYGICKYCMHLPLNAVSAEKTPRVFPKLPNAMLTRGVLTKVLANLAMGDP